MLNSNTKYLANREHSQLEVFLCNYIGEPSQYRFTVKYSKTNSLFARENNVINAFKLLTATHLIHDRLLLSFKYTTNTGQGYSKPPFNYPQKICPCGRKSD